MREIDKELVLILKIKLAINKTSCVKKHQPQKAALILKSTPQSQSPTSLKTLTPLKILLQLTLKIKDYIFKLSKTLTPPPQNKNTLTPQTPKIVPTPFILEIFTL